MQKLEVSAKGNCLEKVKGQEDGKDKSLEGLGEPETVFPVAQAIFYVLGI